LREPRAPIDFPSEHTAKALEHAHRQFASERRFEELQAQAEDFMQQPVEVPLKPLKSVAQQLWARDMMDQAPRKTREQICLENNITWAQLEHYARSSTDGLPEKSGRKAPVKQATKPTKSTKKVKEV
jgi:hypothetical protein